tara:strand:+ start:11112 stop:11333 length:222 start_codon:yes stop_codon:yes gene_type:complete
MIKKKSKMEKFGEEVLDCIKESCRQGQLEEDSEGLMEMAERHGLVRRVEYDFKKHGDIEDADEGDIIWWWGTK